MTGLTDTDIRLSDEWQLTQAADGDAPLCSGLECLYQNIILEALTQPGDLFYDLTFGWGSTTSSSLRTTTSPASRSRSGPGRIAEARGHTPRKYRDQRRLRGRRLHPLLQVPVYRGGDGPGPHGYRQRGQCGGESSMIDKDTLDAVLPPSRDRGAPGTNSSPSSRRRVSSSR